MVPWYILDLVQNIVYLEIIMLSWYMGFSVEYRLSRNNMVPCYIYDLAQNIVYLKNTTSMVLWYTSKYIGFSVEYRCLGNSMVSCIYDLVQNIVYLENIMV